jgi:molybdenum cofactor synthesis domain-containing protein
MRVAVLTISDSVSRGEREDRTGPAVTERCKQLGWEVVAAEALPDERATIASRLSTLADAGLADIILTAGGTGIGPRDATPEATFAACEKPLPGVGELMRQRGRESNLRAALSRGVAAVRAKCLVVNLPGSPRGAVESLDAVAELLPHAVEVLHGAKHD